MSSMVRTSGAREFVEGVCIDGPKHQIMLKWHRLRLVAGDTDFTMARLRQGIDAGASLEIDLRRHAEHGFVCLHDAVLDSETSGSGDIHSAGVAALRRLRLREHDGSVGDEPLLLLEDLVAVLAAGGHPSALVQFDLKEYLRDLDALTISGFAELVTPVCDRVVLSGDDWEAVKALGARLPVMRLGFDPSDLPEARNLTTTEDFARFARFTLSTAPEATFIYLEYHLVIDAIAAGFDLVGALQAGNRMVDAWTLDLNSSADLKALAVLIDSGVDQISSNDCVAIERAARALARNTDELASQILGLRGGAL